MANMTFKANLLPNTNLGYSLGSDNQRWNIYGDLYGTTWIRGPLKIGINDSAADTGYASDNVGSQNYISFYGLYGDGPSNFNHTFIGESVYGSKTAANEQSELLLFHGNDPGAGSGPDRIRLYAGQVDIQVYPSALSGTWDTIRASSGTQIANFSSTGESLNGLLKITNNSNTVTIGSQNASWTHIYNTASVPFIFNNSLAAVQGDLGVNSYPWKNLVLGKNNTSTIRFITDRGNWEPISFLDTSADAYGVGVRIGACGLTVVGAGESSTNLISAASLTTGNESLYLTADSEIFLESTCNEIANRKGIKISNGNIIPVVKESNSNNTLNLGASGVRFAHAYLGSADSYGGTTQPIYWDNGVPKAANAYSTLLTAFSTSTNTISITVGGTTKTTTAVTSVSNTWTAGTTAGPTIKTTVNGVAGAAVAIPSASASASGAVTTGAQTFAGDKTFNGNLYQASGKLITQNTATTVGTAPSSNFYGGGLHFRDTANVTYGYFRGMHLTNQNLGVQVEARRQISGTWKYNTLNLLVNTSGGAVVQVTDAAAWRTAIGAAASSHTHSYVPLAGGTMTGALLGSKTNLGSTAAANHFGQLYLGRGTADSKALNSANPLIEFANTDRSQYAQIIYTDYNNQGGSDSITFVSNQSDLRIYAPKVYGAVWNDYAEYRQSIETEPGRCIRETGNGDLILTTERLQKGCEIISDTFGFSIGESPTCKTPTAASGRVLAYLYEDIETAKQHIGDPVCSGPNGTVSIMTEAEERQYPSRIIGTISEIPNYDIWYAGTDGKLEISINGRIWIRIR